MKKLVATLAFLVGAVSATAYAQPTPTTSSEPASGAGTTPSGSVPGTAPAATPVAQPPLPAAPAEAAPKPKAPPKLNKVRLDLSTPDVPAFTALNVSPSKVSTPTNIKDLVAAVSSGINASGQVQSGVAIEFSPAKLLDNAISAELTDNTSVWQSYLGNLAVSAATNSVAAADTTSMQAALGVRWALGGYTPEADRVLALCINASIPAPADPGDLDANGDPVVPQLSTDTAAFKQARQHCRDEAKAANLASSAFQLSYVYSAQASGSSRIKDFGSLADTVWLSASYGYNTFNRPSNDAEKRGRALAAALGIQPTLMARYDARQLTDVSGRQHDLFIGLRLPFIAQTWSFFVEAGYEKANLSDEPVPPAIKKDRVPVGLGADLRLADGTWLGLFAGADFKSGSLFSLGNIKWALGEDRPYSYPTN